MVFPFGVSISDFIAGIKLFKDAIGSLSDTRGASVEFNQLRQSLESLDKAFQMIPKFNTATHDEALSPAIEGTRRCVTNFLVGVAKFDILNDKSVSNRKLKRSFRQIQWAVCKREDVKKFRIELETHISSIEMHLLSFQM